MVSTQSTGRKPKLAALPYGSDMALWKHVASTPTIVYGPGEYRLAQSPNEYVSIKQTQIAANVLFDAVFTLLKPSVKPEVLHVEIPTVVASQSTPTLSVDTSTPTEPTTAEEKPPKEAKSEPSAATARPLPQPQRGWLRQLFYDLRQI
eukprot:TRINITY_DN5289_c0_g3_i1.p1 TRINITY_DN5289_c0_g3~~TRINITY_DN5289_c0_g3_i1.p1  ORF type:complete len:148 (-),score=34.41 TRINITY_DN5289_c0_g3_i1:94-537(-)